MSPPDRYSPDAPSREDVAALAGAVVLEFGTDWCGICRAAQPAIRAGLAGHDHLQHLKIEDGKGRALGRSFRVTLWPTLILLRDGVEVARVVRPQSAAEVAAAASHTQTKAETTAR